MARYPELTGKNAIVTGGSTGIGEAICYALAESGVNVVVNGQRHAEAAGHVAARVRERGVRAVSALADVSHSDDAQRLYEQAVAELGDVDILINGAGGFPQMRQLVDTPEDEWDDVINRNLKSAFLCCKVVLPRMLERRWGRIVNISSDAARMPIRLTAAHYAASKAGLLGLTRHLAREVADRGVTVNATCPSTTRSPRIEALYGTEAEAAAAISLTPIGRLAEPGDQAGVVAFLCSNEAAYITGATIDVSGGKITL